MEARFEVACRDGVIPGAVLLAATKDGSYTYSRPFGYCSLSSKPKPAKSNSHTSLSTATPAPAHPMTLDTMMYIASCTKLMTTIAVLQCVERGLVGLDEDIVTGNTNGVNGGKAWLEELGTLGILGEDGVVRRRERPITLRHLLTHSSGLTYPFLSPRHQKYYLTLGFSPLGPPGPTVPTRHSHPLLYEPGTDWSYGSSLDWAGLLVERLVGKTLEEYMKENIWRRIGVGDDGHVCRGGITFWPYENEKITERLAGMVSREDVGDENGYLKVVDGGRILGVRGAKACFGGSGAVAGMPDFFKVLLSLLHNDEGLLRRETVRIMFEGHLSEGSRAALKRTFADKEKRRWFIGEFPEKVGLDWGFGGVVTVEGDEDYRGQGTMIWSGLPNLFWLIDRRKEICLLYGGQVVPPGDKQTGDLISLFEKTMYERAIGARAKM